VWPKFLITADELIRPGIEIHGSASGKPEMCLMVAIYKIPSDKHEWLRGVLPQDWRK
jgi:hypothetical protein